MPLDDYEVVWHGAMGRPLSGYLGGSSAALAERTGPPVPSFTQDEHAKLHGTRGRGTPWRHADRLVAPRAARTHYGGTTAPDGESGASEASS
jgi:hypothetical protein